MPENSKDKISKAYPNLGASQSLRHRKLLTLHFLLYNLFKLLDKTFTMNSVILSASKSLKLQCDSQELWYMPAITG
jgi:hypothetical protein